MDDQNESYEGLPRKREEDEKCKLINELCYKHSCCIRLAPHIQQSSKCKSVLMSTELYAQRLTFFSRREGTLHKCKVQNLHMKAQCAKEKIFSALQGYVKVVKAYEAYGLLITAKEAFGEWGVFRKDLYYLELKCVSEEPAFVNEYIGE
ncbi:hypothetical protein Aduo_011401 [Ancylostoma duodenale]